MNKYQYSNLHFWNIWIRFTPLVLIHVFEETGTLVVFHVGSVYFQRFVVSQGFLLGLSLELSYSSVLDFLVQFLLD